MLEETDPDGTADDGPVFARRGIIEGFYGAPWSHEERLEMFRFAGRVRLNSYVYAPKDDPFHRERWREPYPDAELDLLAQLAEAAAEEGVDFVYALHPAGSMRFSDDADHALLAAKVRHIAATGVRSFALLFDDVPLEPVHEEDRSRFGGDARGLGIAHAEAVTRVIRDVLDPAGLPLPIVVPTDYAGVQESEYRRAFADGLPADVLVWWTGRDIVVADITRADIDAASAVFGDRLALWDNFPVNDFDRGRAFLGPLTGRPSDVAGSGLRGVWANPMVESAPSAFALATFADWAWNPRLYDPARSAAAALRFVAGSAADRLAPLVRTLSSWPPSAPMDADLAAQADAVLAGGDAAVLRSRFVELAALGAVVDDTALVRGLRPWLDAAADVGRAGLAALDLLDGTGDAAAARRALAAADAHTAKVATDVVPAFVDEILSRSADTRLRRG